MAQTDWVSRGSLRAQLTLMLAALGLAIGIVAALAIGGLIELRRTTEQTIEQIGARSYAAEEIAVLALQCRRYEKDMFLAIADPAARDASLSLWRSSLTSLQDAIGRYGALAANEDQRRIAANWRGSSAAYQRAVLEISQQIAGGQIRTPEAANQALAPYKNAIRSLTDGALAQVESDRAQLAHANGEIMRQTEQLTLLMGGVGLAAIGFAIVSAVLFPRRLLAPIRDLRRATAQLSAGDLGIRARVRRADELGALAASFNQMADRIQRQVAELDQGELVRQQNEQLRALLDLVRDLEAPAIPISDTTLLVPIVGELDPRRVGRLQQRALAAAHSTRARTVIIDLTGVTTLDTSAAQAIDQLIGAMQLIGVRVIISGISAQIAQTAAQLSLRFGDAQIVGRVHDALALAS